MELRVLGTVAVLVDGRELRLGARQARFVLAVLLLEVNRLVTVERLVELLWPHGAPATARGIVHTHVSRLRGVLAGLDGVTLARNGPGYVLGCDPDLVDVHRFRALVAAARADIDDEDRVALLSEALRLWRGAPLASAAPAEVARRLCHGVDELRLTAVEELADATLRLGRHDDLVDELGAFVHEHPYRQRAVGLLMTALHRAQRDAEALRVYRELRDRLADETGLEPSPELRRLELVVLRGGASDSDPAPAARRAVVVPRELPAPAAGFVGRAEQSDELDALLAEAAVCVVTGTAGVGKTALAVRWAHRSADRFPDGQVFVELRGCSGGPAVAPGEALARLVRLLGVEPDRVPPDVDGRAALYRSLLADRRVLVVLDDAADAAQVRPLLPGAAGCRVLVTSRDGLPGLVAIEGARRLRLDVLAAGEAHALVAEVVGASRLAAQPTAAAELVRRCAGLPLALRIAAANLLDRPRRPLADYVAELGDPLGALTVGGDDSVAVRAAFDASYRRLDEPARTLFRLFGAHPGADLGEHAAAAMAGCAPAEAGRLLAVLAGAHLARETEPGRYAVHDLLRAYAAGRLDPAERRVALTRLLDHYVGTAAAAMDQVDPHRRRLPGATGPTAPPFPDRARATAWLAAERTALVAAVEVAAAGEWPRHALRLTHTLWRYFYLRTRLDDWIGTHHAALPAARALGDEFAEAEILTNLGTAELTAGRLGHAAEHYRSALPLRRRIGDLAGEANTLGNLGGVLLVQGRYRDAVDHFRRAHDLHRRAGDRRGEARGLANRALVHVQLGEHAEAIERSEQALALFRLIGEHAAASRELANLGCAHLRAGHAARAESLLGEALTQLRRLGMREGEGRATNWLGVLRAGAGHFADAVERHRAALAIGDEIGDPGLRCEVRNDLGATLRLAGRPRDAIEHLARALADAEELGDRYEQARAHHGLGRARADLGATAAAEEHLRRALALFDELGLPDAAMVRPFLDQPAAGPAGHAAHATPARPADPPS